MQTIRNAINRALGAEKRGPINRALMRLFGVEVWGYVSMPPTLWQRLSYYDGSVHHVTVGWLTIVVNYSAAMRRRRAAREKGTQP